MRTCTSCVVKLMAMHSRLRACTKKLSPTEGSPTLAHSQGYINGSDGGRAGRPKSVTPDVEGRVLQRVAQSPGTSTRRIAAQERVLSRSSVCGEFYIANCCTPTTSNAYRVSVLRTSLPELTSARGCNNSVLNPPFLSKILFTDEAGFTRDGIFNYHNCHVWCAENPYAIHESWHQRRFSLIIWAEVLGDGLTGPHIFPNKLTGKRYRRFLRKFFQASLRMFPFSKVRTCGLCMTVYRHIFLELWDGI
jgi:hypothetical protein